jgi:hypothetical protein
MIPFRIRRFGFLPSWNDKLSHCTSVSFCFESAMSSPCLVRSRNPTHVAVVMFGWPCQSFRSSPVSGGTKNRNPVPLIDYGFRVKRGMTCLFTRLICAIYFMKPSSNCESGGFTANRSLQNSRRTSQSKWGDRMLQDGRHRGSAQMIAITPRTLAFRYTVYRLIYLMTQQGGRREHELSKMRHKGPQKKSARVVRVNHSRHRLIRGFSLLIAS